jgi:WD40 repeat protein
MGTMSSLTNHLKIWACFVTAVVMAGGLFGQSQSTVPAAQALEIRRPELTLSNASSTNVGVAYSSGGRYLAVASDNSIRVYEIHSGGKFTAGLIRTLNGHTGPILGIAFSDANTLVSISRDQTAKIWNVETDKLLHTADVPFAEETQFALARGNQSLAADTSFGKVRLWNYQTGKILQTFEPNDSLASAIAFTPDGKQLVIGTEKGVVRVIDVATWPAARTIDLDSPIKSVAASAEHAAVGYWDGTVAFLNLGGQPSVPELKKQTDAINALAFNPKGEVFASASADHTIKLWNTATLKAVCSLEGHNASVLAVAFSPDGSTLVSVDAEGTLNFWAVAKP